MALCAMPKLPPGISEPPTREARPSSCTATGSAARLRARIGASEKMGVVDPYLPPTGRSRATYCVRRARMRHMVTARLGAAGQH